MKSCSDQGPKWRAWLPLLLPLTLLAGTSVQGVNFGRHWDERVHQFSVLRSVESGRFLPSSYNYPGVPYLLALSAVTPEYLAARVQGLSPDDTRKSLVRRVRSVEYILRTRRLFALVSCLAVVWTYAAVLLWRRDAFEAMLAAGFLGTSWEVAYHLRWIAPDGIMMQFAALALLGSVLAARGSRRFLTVAALGAGLGMSTKYQLGLLGLPAGLSALRYDHRFRLFLAVAAIMVLCFLLTTPGVLLDTRHFVESLSQQYDVYAKPLANPERGGRLWGYRIEPGLPHLLRSGDYFANVLFSPYRPLALLSVALVTLGVVSLRREPRLLIAVLLGFPAIYVLYMSRQHIMVVRNLLPVVPFLAVLAARGVGALRAWSPPPLRRGVTIFVSLLLATNAAWLIRTSQTVRRPPAEYASALSDYFADRPDRSFGLSPRVWDAISKLPLPPGPNVHRLEELEAPVDEVAFFRYEGLDSLSWPGNRRQPEIRVFGPLEVNLDYYPNWSGRDRIVVMPWSEASRLEVSLLPVPRETGRQETGR